MWTKAFWKGAGERAIKSFGQGVLAGLSLVIVNGIGDIRVVDFAGVISVGGFMALYSLMTSIANPTFVAGIPVPEAVVLPVVTVPVIDTVLDSEGAAERAPL